MSRGGLADPGNTRPEHGQAVRVIKINSRWRKLYRPHSRNRKAFEKSNAAQINTALAMSANAIPQVK